MTDDADKTDILIVDDLPSKLLSYQTVLEELGQNVIAAHSGPEALKAVLNHDFAVILLDVNMPEMDGFETAQLIRKRRRSSHTPIIFLTAFADEVRTAQGYAYGAVDYIPTPVVPEILRAKVRVFVELYRMRQQVARQAEEQARRAAAEEEARRSVLLAEASRILSASLDLDETLARLAGFVVPALADLSLVCSVDERGEPLHLQAAWVEPGVAEPLRSAGDALDPETWLGSALLRCLRSGTREQLGPVDPPVPGPRLALPAPQASTSRQPTERFFLHSVLALPLVVRGRKLGAFVLGLGPSARRFETRDRALAEDLAGRAATALDNALLVRDIQDNDRRKNEFLAMLAHELRNPLAPIRTAVEILRLRGPQQSELVWAREVIERQVKHLVRIVDDLLDVSRFTRGRITLQHELLDARDVISTAVETSKPLIEARHHSLEVVVPEAPIWLWADAARLAQVLANLLNNAAKYTPDRGKIWVSVAREDGQAAFRVRDTGPGIPREMLSKIFDLFTQVDRSIDRSQGGLGIGLTLVRRLVELHQGTVEAFSDGPGHGSEFVVRLPVAADGTGKPVAAASARSGQAAAERARPRVLVVDDNQDAAESLATLLQHEGCEVRQAHDGNAALAAASIFDPQVVLLDLGLPQIDGYEVARRLRSSPGGPGLLLVAISGYGQDEDLQRSREAGFDRHLIKPVALPALRQLLAAKG